MNTDLPSNSISDMMDAEFSIKPVPVLTPEPAPKPAPEVPAPTPEVKKFRKEIDLGDGGGVQVFEAETAEELIDKLTTAQTNATAKIRQLNRQLKARPQPQKPAVTAPKPEPKPLTPDEEFIIGQQFAQEPGKMFDRLFEAKFGMTPAQASERMAAAAQVERMVAEQAAAQEFMQDNPDYFATPKNGRALSNFLNTEGLPMTKENLAYAYNELAKSGLLEAKPKPQTEPVQPRIEPPAPKKVNTSLSERDFGKSEVVSGVNVPSVEEIMSLPLEQARERIVYAMHQARQQRVSQ